MRDAQGRDRFDLTEQTRAQPGPVRAIVDRFLLRRILDDDFSLRGQAMGFLGNLIEEGLAELLPPRLGALAMVGALGLVWRRRSAWSLAMVIQAAIQGVSLYFYFGLPAAAVVRTGLIYGIMASGILVVLYLNSADVRLAFRRTPHPFDSHPDREAPHEFTA